MEIYFILTFLNNFKMKKILFAVAILFGTMFVSCNGNSQANSSNDTTAVDSVSDTTVVLDSVPADSIVK